MGDSSSSGEQNAVATPARVSVGATIIVVAGVCAAWFAAGSAGMFARPLQIAMTWLALGVAIVAGWPTARASAGRRPDPRRAASSSGLRALDGRSRGRRALGGVDPGHDRPLPAGPRRPRRAARVAGRGRARRLSARLHGHPGRLVPGQRRRVGLRLARRTVVQQPLDVGATYGGVDFLVLMAALYAGWLMADGAAAAEPRNRSRPCDHCRALRVSRPACVFGGIGRA